MNIANKQTTTAQTLSFSKMHGCGNDFIMLNAFTQALPAAADDMGRLAQILCDRRFGVGADGVLALYPSAQADFQMRLFQPDGSEAEMCGNGMRCAALFARREGIVSQDEFVVETLAGLIRPSIDPQTGLVCVDMGQPRLAAAQIPCLAAEPNAPVLEQSIEILGREFKFNAVSMGNPHAVIFIDSSPQNLAVTKYGPLLEHHSCFPARANIEFAHLLDERHIEARVWERSVGETLACGTGACAIAVAALLTGRAQNPVNIKLPGGSLQISWRQGESVYMTGPAQEVYRGVLELAALPPELSESEAQN